MGHGPLFTSFVSSSSPIQYSMLDVRCSMFIVSDDISLKYYKNKKAALPATFLNLCSTPHALCPLLLRHSQHLLDGCDTIQYFLDAVLAQAQHFFPACFVLYLIGIIGTKNEAF